MSQPLLTVGTSAAPMPFSSIPFSALVETLASFSVSYSRRGEDLVLRNAKALPTDVLIATKEHKAQLLDLCDTQSAFGSETQARSFSRTSAKSAILELVRNAAPILHSQIVRDLAQRGLSAVSIRSGIAEMQQEGRIEHNLTTGYILCRPDASTTG